MTEMVHLMGIGIWDIISSHNIVTRSWFFLGAKGISTKSTSPKLHQTEQDTNQSEVRIANREEVLGIAFHSFPFVVASSNPLLLYLVFQILHGLSGLVLLLITRLN